MRKNMSDVQTQQSARFKNRLFHHGNPGRIQREFTQHRCDNKACSALWVCLHPFHLANHPHTEFQIQMSLPIECAISLAIEYLVTTSVLTWSPTLDFATGQPQIQPHLTSERGQIFFGGGAQQSPVGQGLLIHEVSRSHTTTHHSRLNSSGRGISSSHRPQPDNTQHSQQASVGFEPSISAGERPQTYALDRAATGTGRRTDMRYK